VSEVGRVVLTHQAHFLNNSFHRRVGTRCPTRRGRFQVGRVVTTRRPHSPLSFVNSMCYDRHVVVMTKHG